MVRQHYVPQDARVARDVRALVGAGHEVDLVCLRREGEPGLERHAGLTIWRVPLRHTRSRSATRYLVEYASFFIASATLVAALHARRRFALVQVHSLPDVLVYSAIGPKLGGARVLLDLQECMPEFFATKFGAKSRRPVVRLLRALEQRSIRFADHVLTPTILMRETFTARGANADVITVVMDGADETIFAPSVAAGGSSGKHFHLISHGTVEQHYGLDLVLRAVAGLRHEIPALRVAIYGDGPHLNHLRQLAQDLSIGERVLFSAGFVPVDELVSALASADAGIVAIRRDPFRDVTIPGKLFDFIAMHKPVIASRTRSIERLFGPSCFELFDSDDVGDLCRAIRTVYFNAAHRERLVRRATDVAAPYQWSRQRAVYLQVVDALLAGRPVAARPSRGAS